MSLRKKKRRNTGESPKAACGGFGAVHRAKLKKKKDEYSAARPFPFFSVYRHFVKIADSSHDRSHLIGSDVRLSLLA